MRSFDFRGVEAADIVRVNDLRTGQEVRAWGRNRVPAASHPFTAARLVRIVDLDIASDGELTEVLAAVRAIRGEASDSS